MVYFSDKSNSNLLAWQLLIFSKVTPFRAMGLPDAI